MVSLPGLIVAAPTVLLLPIGVLPLIALLLPIVPSVILIRERSSKRKSAKDGSKRNGNCDLPKR